MKITEEALSAIEHRVENSFSCIYQNFKTTKNNMFNRRNH